MKHRSTGTLPHAMTALAVVVRAACVCNMLQALAQKTGLVTHCAVATSSSFTYSSRIGAR